MQKGATVKFHPDYAELIALEGTKFPTEQHERLYYLCTNSIVQKRNESLQMWHRIMGHCNVDDISKLEQAVQGTSINNHEKFD